MLTGAPDTSTNAPVPDAFVVASSGPNPSWNPDMSNVSATIHKSSPPSIAGLKRTSSSHSPASKLINWSGSHVNVHTIGQPNSFGAIVILAEFQPLPSIPPSLNESHASNVHVPLALAPANDPAKGPPAGWNDPVYGAAP